MLLTVLFQTPTIAARWLVMLKSYAHQIRRTVRTEGIRDMTAARVEVREAREADMPSFAAIVNPFIETTTFNFRTGAQDPAEWLDEWKLLHERYPWLVATIDEHVVGFAYAGPWKARNAYDWCAESTLYVAAGQHRHGIGRTLYTRLGAILDRQGYRTTIGVISLPNPASVALHEACGYQHAGTLSSVGYKMGRWCDVGFWQRPAPGDAPPGEILPLSEIDLLL